MAREGNRERKVGVGNVVVFIFSGEELDTGNKSHDDDDDELTMIKNKKRRKSMTKMVPNVDVVMSSATLVELSGKIRRLLVHVHFGTKEIFWMTQILMMMTMTLMKIAITLIRTKRGY
ncbi:hypothetical protein RDABS01_021683 [Bienertia sinuspersici]